MSPGFTPGGFNKILAVWCVSGHPSHMEIIKRIAAQPLLHFVLIGVVVFAAFLALDDRTVGPSTNQILITQEQAAQLSSGFTSVWRRPPSTKELRGLIDDHIREEVLVREALALGLDRNDTVLRRRLRQKMEFLIESAAEALEPKEEELRAYFKENADRFAADAKVAFQQVFLGEAPGEAEAIAALGALAAGADPASDGARTLLPIETQLSPATVVDGTFGRGFFQSVLELDLDQWAGPVASGFGQHLVRLTAKVEAELPPFENVRDKILSDWRRQKAKDLSEAQIQNLLERYEVIRPSMADAAATGK
jgi:hypothetical protein